MQSETVQLINSEMGNVWGETEETCANPGSEKRPVYFGSGINSEESKRPLVHHSSV